MGKKLKLRLLCWLAFVIYRVLSSTYRVRYFHTEHKTQAAALHPRGSFVYGLWHEYFFVCVAAHPRQNITPMISRSNDGELISFIGKKLGFSPVRGSSSRGGTEAREELYGRIASGLTAAFTADGPKGPRRKLKSGLVDLSRTGQMAILPVAAAADRYWRLRSWDQSLIPKPFAKIAVVYSAPYLVPAAAHGAAFAREKQLVTTKLNQLDDIAAAALNSF